ncbi:hypothetical protein K491DRAFT_677762 [Lophiostoma macrostomum CBS 122681]|uniref:Uncharacterized protein n=1 Tax=Lophiostoma macrostomum CBS 122681 TaxID=1314788 RepID=A0A6A6TA28_9PLEO|nr:hypothetical protein K491DRAFT_677762 [Lophiostoma macrostomum CBS 122681]
MLLALRPRRSLGTALGEDELGAKKCAGPPLAHRQSTPVLAGRVTSVPGRRKRTHGARHAALPGVPLPAAAQRRALLPLAAGSHQTDDRDASFPARAAANRTRFHAFSRASTVLLREATVHGHSNTATATRARLFARPAAGVARLALAAPPPPSPQLNAAKKQPTQESSGAAAPKQQGRKHAPQHQAQRSTGDPPGARTMAAHSLGQERDPSSIIHRPRWLQPNVTFPVGAFPLIMQPSAGPAAASCCAAQRRVACKRVFAGCVVASRRKLSTERLLPRAGLSRGYRPTRNQTPGIKGLPQSPYPDRPDSEAVRRTQIEIGLALCYGVVMLVVRI